MAFKTFSSDGQFPIYIVGQGWQLPKVSDQMRQLTLLGVSGVGLSPTRTEEGELSNEKGENNTYAHGSIDHLNLLKSY